MVGTRGSADRRGSVGGEGEGRRVEGEVDGGRRGRLGGVEVVDEGREGVKGGRGSVPVRKGLARVPPLPQHPETDQPTTTSFGLTLRWRSSSDLW
jgi:hypothetical protein